MKRKKRRAATLAGRPANPKAAARQSAVAPDAESMIVQVVRGLLLLFAVALPLLYDPVVPEVAGDIRWAAASVVAASCAVLLLLKACADGSATLNLRWPLIFWLALGLVFWAALSLVDALTWMFGLTPLKSLAAQMTVMAVVYVVATPAFLRHLMWAIVLPVAFTSALGIVQFHGWHLPGLAGDIAQFYAQSAVPGSTFANKNLAASWTAMLLPGALYLLLTARGWYGQAAASAILALGSVFLIYSRARASWIALTAGVLTLVALVILVPAWRQAVLRHLDWRRALWLALPLAAMLRFGGDISPLNHVAAVNRSPAEQMAALMPTESGWRDGGRAAYNLNSIAIVRDHWFNGVGLGGFYASYPAYHDAVVPTPRGGYDVFLRPQRAHTDFVQAFDEMGIPGGLLYAGVFMCAIAMAFSLAGARAGALGGMLVGTGALGAMLTLIVLLERHPVLALPPPWNLAVESGLAALIALLIYGCLRQARALRAETNPADDLQLMGMAAGIGVLTICINAVMDFPLQMPTAPATAALLMGATTWIYMVHRPAAAFGPASVLRLGPLALAGFFVALIGAWGAILYDASRLRDANALLKLAIVRNNAGVNDAPTLEVIERALKAYPNDPRVHDELGLAYIHYRGSPPIPFETRIQKMELVVKTDPWSANHLINLASLHLQRAESLQNQGEAKQAALALQRAEELDARLQRVAAFSYYSWTVRGLLRLLQDRPEESITLFRRVLEVDPTYAPAQQRLAMAIERAKRRP